MGRAHELSDSGHAREPFIQGVTALELAIEQFLKQKTEKLDEHKSHLNQFDSLSLKTKTFVLATSANLIPPESLKKTIKAIDIRNKIAHEGHEPTSDEKSVFPYLINCAAAFLGIEEFKTPGLHSGNQLSPIEHGGKNVLRAQFSIKEPD